MELVDLHNAQENDALFTTYLHQVREKYELDHAAYAGMNPISGTTHGHVTYSADWTSHYFQNKFHEIDPTLSQARRSIAPVDWGRLGHSEHFQAVFNDARQFGIGDRGMTIPVRGPYGDIGGFSVTRDCPEHEWALLKQNIISELQTVAVHLHDMVIRSDPLSRVLNAPSLSSREIEILQWTAAGKSQQDIGDILSISHRTVEVHLRSSRQKLSSLTTPQAIGRAISLGLIYPR